MSDNLRHWIALSRTDPAHTKSFQRAGGFKGTAIKPIYTVQKMTEHFGPCGIGWGMEKPEFLTMPAADEILVYCTVALWYMDGETRGVVYGVGGDKVVMKGKDSLRTSDEAFKAAYTDALSNAMKQIGVSADVHMGKFDDHKYVRDLQQEFADEPEPKPPARTAPQTPRARALRDHSFFTHESYALDPKALGSWSEWERQFRHAAETCLKLDELDKLHDDNRAHINKFSDKATPPAVEALRQFVEAERKRLLPGIAA